MTCESTRSHPSRDHDHIGLSKVVSDTEQGHLEVTGEGKTAAIVEPRPVAALPELRPGLCCRSSGAGVDGMDHDLGAVNERDQVGRARHRDSGLGDDQRLGDASRRYHGTSGLGEDVDDRTAIRFGEHDCEKSRYVHDYVDSSWTCGGHVARP
jgi:hypothetical protein